MGIGDAVELLSCWCDIGDGSGGGSPGEGEATAPPPPPLGLANEPGRELSAACGTPVTLCLVRGFESSCSDT